MTTLYQPKTSRDLLTALGVGSFNATMMIEPLMLTPAVCDPSSASMQLLIKHIQAMLASMGAPVAETGRLDQATSMALEEVAGENWLYRTWFDVGRMLVAAKRAGKRIGGHFPVPAPAPIEPLGVLDLPDVPGGIVTYAVGGYLLYRWLKKKR